MNIHNIITIKERLKNMDRVIVPNRVLGSIKKFRENSICSIIGLMLFFCVLHYVML